MKLRDLERHLRAHEAELLTIPLATAEVAMVFRLDIEEARRKLESVATATRSGADFYSTLPTR